MNPPSLWTWLVGNAVSFVAICIGVLVVGYLFLTTGQYGFQLLVLAAISWHSYRANDRVRAFQSWQREWRAMSGETPTRLTLPRIGGLRYVLGIVAWMFLALLAIGSADDPALRIPVVLFWLATAVMVVAGAYRLIRDGSGRTRSGNSVRVCLGRPVLSPSVEEARKALPHYC